MKNIKLIISYDGTSFFGWQKTKTGPSVEEELERALGRILRHEVRLEAASRTDRGVHARGQSVRFYSLREMEMRRLVRGLNAVLPKTIVVRSAEEMPEAFHPTLDAVGKQYDYDLCLGKAQVPIHRLYSWHIFHALNVQEMRRAVDLLIGKRDFSAFCNDEAKDPVCDLREIFISLCGERMRITLRADRFLYKMVRNLVGLLVYVGCGKMKSEWIPSLLASRDRARGAVTAPAQGLFLSEVFYDIKK